ncbi:hypothetical protein [Moritella dasanensis]|uniref:hypothetical protein n=1 Tax=Moritella dasanensis TaxID=428031 RepID=UPI0002EF255B|nr:hypothetical protein [Moritella dasanensis]
MNHSQQQRFNCLYEQHFINLRLQGKREATVDGDTCSIQRITESPGLWLFSLQRAQQKQSVFVLAASMK